MRILGIAGSLRRDSHNARLLRHVAERAPAGVEIEIWDGLKAIPPYDGDDDVEPAPDPVADLRDAIAEADGLLIATPEYNSSIPGVLKNAIDWASRPRASTPLQNKPAAVIGATTGQVRRRLGPGRDPQGPRLRRRPRRRPRPPRGAGAPRLRRRRRAQLAGARRPRR